MSIRNDIKKRAKSDGKLGLSKGSWILEIITDRQVLLDMLDEIEKEDDIELVKEILKS